MNPIIETIERPKVDLIKAFENIPTPVVHEAMGKEGALSYRIKPLTRGMRICGPAVTIHGFPADNLMLHKAITIAQPGDVLVAGMGAYKESGIWGEITSTACMIKGIQGLVTDAFVRDTKEIIEMGFSIFCQGVSIKGSAKKKVGKINHPLVLEGIHICPGDLILGDDDGVVVVPRERIEEILKKSKEKEAFEKEIINKLKAGATTVDLFHLDAVIEEELEG